MTRWARSGNSQRHQKMPEDPTPWEELAINAKKLKKRSLKNKPISKQLTESTKIAGENEAVQKIQELKENGATLSRKQLKRLKLEAKRKRVELDSGFLVQSMDSPVDGTDCLSGNELSEQKDNKNSPEYFPMETERAVAKNDSVQRNLKLSKKEKRKRESGDEFDDEVTSQYLNHQENSTMEKNLEQSKNMKRKKKPKKASDDGISNDDSSQNLNESNCSQKGRKTSLSDTVEDVNGTKEHLTRRQLKKLKRENRKKQDATSDAEPVNETTSETEDIPNDSTTPSLPSEKKRMTKKEMFLYRLQKKRAEKGILLLPPKVERKLYMIKKRLREKGFPPDMIKDIIRKERRKAELEIRKTSSVICFNCRQTGHVLADCPLPASNASKPDVGICFKCGSTEHTSSKCRKKISGYPFATCFVCKKTGHISRECPDNKHGVYIRGGKCNLCGNINHYRKDCPSLKKKEKEEPSVSAHTIFEGKSVDDEITDFQGVPSKKKKFPKAKIVKF